MIARIVSALPAFAALAGAAVAQDSRAVLNPPTVMTVLNTCVAWAKERDSGLSIAVVDDAGQLRGVLDGGAHVPLSGGVSGAAAEVDEDCAIAGVEAAGLEHGVDQSEAE